MEDETWALMDCLRKNLVLEDKPSNFSESLHKCNDDTIQLVDGNYICKFCNTVTGRYIDHGAEWRFYGADDSKQSDPTRCGLPVNDLLPDSSLGSIIGYTSNESYEFKIMRKYHMWNCMPYKDRSLFNIFETLTLNALNNGIPKSIIDEAKTLYKKISESRISRGDNRNGLIASSIYVACKNNKVPRSAKEIAKIFNLKTATLTRGCKRFQEIMKINMESTMADDFINRFSSKLGLDTIQKDKCRQIVNIVEELSIVSENTPPSIVAGCIFLCSVIYDWNLCKKDIAASCDISQVTVSKCFKKLIEYKETICSFC